MISDSWIRLTFLVALCALFACSDNGTSTAQIDAGTDLEGDEYSKVFGEHRIHFNAFKSTFLTPEVAKLYRIRHADDLGVCMVSINQKDTPGVGVEARVNGTATNLASQLRMLKFDEIREGSAIYHVCTFPVASKEQLTFKVDVEIAPTGEKYAVTWQQEFWQN